MKPLTKTISFSEELQERLEYLVNELNKQQIAGTITQSKIIRIAVAEYLEKQNKIQRILKEHSEVNKSAEDLLKENGML